MKIDFLPRFELCTFCQHACSQLRFERAQTIYVVRKKDQELKIVTNVGKAYRDESLALGKTKWRLLSHGWKIDRRAAAKDRKSTRLNSSHVSISYAVFCL